MSTGRPKDIHTKILPVDEGIEILILQYLAKYSQKDYQFHDYAKSKRGILGSQSSSATQKQQQLRKRAKNRLYYLRTNTPVLFRLLRERGFKTFEGCAIPTEDQVDTDQEEDDISSNPCKFSVIFYFKLRLYYWFPFFLQETPLSQLTSAIFFPFFVIPIFN
jgi:hypothetical protein